MAGGNQNLGVLSVKITADAKELLAALKTVSTAMEKLGGELNKQVRKFDESFKQLDKMTKAFQALKTAEREASKTTKLNAEETDALNKKQAAAAKVTKQYGENFKTLSTAQQNTIKSIRAQIGVMKESSAQTIKSGKAWGIFGQGLKNVADRFRGFHPNIVKWSTAVKNSEANLSGFSRQMTKMTKNWEKNNLASITGTTAIQAMQRAWKSSLGDAGKFALKMNELEKISTKSGASTARAATNTTSMGRAMGQTKQHVQGLLQKVTGLDLKLGDFARRIILVNSIWKLWNGTLKLGRDALQNIFAFDQQLHNIAAITVATTEEINNLAVSLRNLAVRTPFSAAELGAGLTQLGQAGFKAAEGMAALNAVVSLSIGTLSSIDESVKVLTTTLRAFKLTAEQATDVSNVLVAAINRSKLTVEGLNTAFNFAAPAASGAGLQIEELAAALGTMANQGIRASTQGTGVRQVLAALLAPTDKFRSELRALSINMDDINPLFNDFGDILQTLKDAGFSTAAAFRALDRRTANSANALIQNVAAYKSLKLNIEGTNAAAIAMETQMTGLEKTFERLKQRLLDLFNTDGARLFFKSLLRGFGQVIDQMAIFVAKTGNMIESIGNVGNAFEFLKQKTIEALEWIIKLTGDLTKMAGVLLIVTGAIASLAGGAGLPAMAAGMALTATKVTLAGAALVYMEKSLLKLIKPTDGLKLQLKGLGDAFDIAATAQEKFAKNKEKLEDELVSQEAKAKSRAGIFSLFSKAARVSGLRSHAAADYEDPATARIRDIKEEIAKIDGQISSLPTLIETHFRNASSRFFDQIEAENQEALRTFSGISIKIESLRGDLAVLEEAQHKERIASKQGHAAHTAAIDERVRAEKQLRASLSANKFDESDNPDLFATTNELRDGVSLVIDRHREKYKELQVELAPTVELQREFIATLEAIKVRAAEAGTDVEFMTNIIDRQKLSFDAYSSSQEVNVAFGKELADITKNTATNFRDLAKELDSVEAKAALFSDEQERLRLVIKGSAVEIKLAQERLAELKKQENPSVVDQEVQRAIIKAAEEEAARAKARLAGTVLGQKRQLAFDREIARHEEDLENQRIANYNSEIERINAVGKKKQQVIAQKREELDLEVKLGSLTTEDARVAGLRLEQEASRAALKTAKEKLKAARALKAEVDKLKQKDRQLEIEEQKKIQNAAKTVETQELAVQTQEHRLNLLQREIIELTTMQQIWQQMADTVRDDLADAITDVVFEGGKLSDIGDVVKDSLLDGFKNAFAESIKEKLKFDIKFKDNIFGLGENVIENIGGAFAKVFSAISGDGASGGGGNVLSTLASFGSGGGGGGIFSGLGGLFGGGGGTGGIFTAGLIRDEIGGNSTAAMAGRGAIDAYRAYGAVMALAEFSAVTAGGGSLTAGVSAAAYSATGGVIGTSAASYGASLGGYGLGGGLASPAVLNGSVGAGGIGQTGAASTAAGAAAIVAILAVIIFTVIQIINAKKFSFLKTISKAAFPIIEEEFGRAGLTGLDIGVGRESSLEDDLRRFDPNIGRQGVHDDRLNRTQERLEQGLRGRGSNVKDIADLADALTALGFGVASGLDGKRGFNAAVGLSNRILLDLVESGLSLKDLDLERLFEGLGGVAGNFSTTVEQVAESFEHLDKKGKLNADTMASLESAIRGAALIFSNEFPKGIDVASKAVRQFRIDGEVDMEKLQETIQGTLETAAGGIGSIVEEPLKLALSGGTLDTAFNLLGKKFDEFIQQQVIGAFTQSLTQSVLQEGIVVPLTDQISELNIQLASGEITFEQFGAAIRNVMSQDVLPSFQQFRSIFEDTFLALGSTLGLPLEGLRGIISDKSFLDFGDKVDDRKGFLEPFTNATSAADAFRGGGSDLEFLTGTALVDSTADTQDAQEEYNNLKDQFKKYLLKQIKKVAISQGVDPSVGTVDQGVLNEAAEHILSGGDPKKSFPIVFYALGHNNAGVNMHGTVSGGLGSGLTFYLNRKGAKGGSTQVGSTTVESDEIKVGTKRVAGIYNIVDARDEAVAARDEIFRELEDLTGVSFEQFEERFKDLKDDGILKASDKLFDPEVMKIVFATFDEEFADLITGAEDAIKEGKKNIRKALTDLSENVSNVEEFIAAFALISQAREEGIIGQNRKQTLIEQSLDSLQEELPKAIDVVELFEAALNEAGELDVDKFTRLVTASLNVFNQLANAFKTSIIEALTSGDTAAAVEKFKLTFKRGIGDSIIDAFVETLTNQLFIATLAPFFDKIGELLSGDASQDDILQFIQDFLPEALAGIEGAAELLGPILDLIAQIFGDNDLLDAYRGTLDKQSQLIADQLSLLQGWQSILDSVNSARNNILFGSGSSQNINAQLASAQGSLGEQLDIFRGGGDVASRQGSASEIINLISSIFGIAQQGGGAGIAGLQTGSAGFQRLQQQLLAILDEVGIAANEGLTELDVLQSQLDILKEIAENTAPDEEEEDDGSTGSSDDNESLTYDANGNLTTGGDAFAVLVASLGNINALITQLLSDKIDLRVENLIVDRIMLSEVGQDSAEGGAFGGLIEEINIYIDGTDALDSNELSEEVIQELIRAVRTGSLGTEIRKVRGSSR